MTSLSYSIKTGQRWPEPTAEICQYLLHALDSWCIMSDCHHKLRLRRSSGSPPPACHHFSSLIGTVQACPRTSKHPLPLDLCAQSHLQFLNVLETKLWSSVLHTYSRSSWLVSQPELGQLSKDSSLGLGESAGQNCLDLGRVMLCPVADMPQLDATIRRRPPLGNPQDPISACSPSKKPKKDPRSHRNKRWGPPRTDRASGDKGSLTSHL